MQISDTFGFTAPPEVVFNSLTDPDRADRWLPFGVRAERLDDHRVRLVAADARAVFDIDTDVDNLGLSWRSPDDQRLHARVRVEDGPAGGSQLHVLISMPAGTADEDQARSVLAETMRHLQRDVSDNFNAG